MTPALLGFRIFCMLWCTSLLVMLRLGFERLTPGWAARFYLVTVASVLPMIWIANDTASRLAEPWAPFQGYKLAVLLAGALSPTQPWLGFAGVAMLTAANLVQYFAFSQEARLLLVVDEPWLSLAFGLFACLVFSFKMRTARIELKFFRARVRAAIAQRLAHRVLTIKDLTNSPIQTLELNSALLRKHCPKEKATLDRVDRSVSKLKEVNRLLQHENEVLREVRGSVSFNALRRIQRRGRM